MKIEHQIIFFVTISCTPPPPFTQMRWKKGDHDFIFTEKGFRQPPPPQSGSEKGTILFIKKEWAGGSQIK